MAPRATLILVISTVLALHLIRIGLAEGHQQWQLGKVAAQTGIDPSRLSHAKLRVWKSILEIVTAQDKEGCYRHPTLYGLYRQAETSGHLIHIELSDADSLTRAGQFRIETLDPTGVRHVTTIRLNLATIARAYVGESARYSNGLIPFAGLRTIQRYAEVLGHELAHAVAVFQNPESLRLYQQIEKESNDTGVGKDASTDPLARLENVRQLMHLSELPAQAAELEIWCELSGATSLSPRAQSPNEISKRNDKHVKVTLIRNF